MAKSIVTTPDLAQKVIDCFGGSTAAAKAIKAPITTVDAWKINGIRQWRWDSLLIAAVHLKVKLPRAFELLAQKRL